MTQFSAEIYLDRLEQLYVLVDVELDKIGYDMERTNPAFDRRDWDKLSRDLLPPTFGPRGDFAQLIGWADEALANAEADDGLEPGETRLVPTLRPVNQIAAE